MKKFTFPLDTVKSFKDMELEELKRLHGQIVQAMRSKEAEIQRLEREYTAEIEEFDQKKQTGVTVIEAQSFDIHTRKLKANIEREYVLLRELQAEEEQRRQRVVEKRQEISSIEKLREKRVIEYNKALQKEEENFIEEIVSNKRVALG